jgi:hypothetical protein
MKKNSWVALGAMMEFGFSQSGENSIKAVWADKHITALTISIIPLITMT